MQATAIGFERERNEDVIITPQWARELLKHNWGGQRNLCAHLVDQTARAITRNQLLPQPLRIAKILDKNSVPPKYRDWEYLMFDGQHRTTASALYGLSFPAGLETWTCKTWQDFLELNELVDIPNRSESDLIKYWLEEHGKLGVWGLNVIKAIKSAIVSRAGINLKFISKTERLMILEQESSLAKKVIKFLGKFESREVKYILRKPVMRAVLDTFELSPIVAERFWTRVISMVNLSSNSPELDLGKWLPDARCRYKKEAATTYSKIIQTWNRVNPNLRIVVQYSYEGNGKTYVKYVVLQNPLAIGLPKERNK